MITGEETRLAEECLRTALEAGAQKVRVTLDKSCENIVSTLNGEVDSVSHCADRSLSLMMIVDGRAGVFATNKMDAATLSDFIRSSVGTVRMLAPDEFRNLPDPERVCRRALTGDELGILDAYYPEVTPRMRRDMALGASVYGEGVLSEEGEYSDTRYDMLKLDSNGTRCRHSETFYDYGVEITVQEKDGSKNSSYWWTSAPFFKDFDPSQCGRIALERARARAGAGPCRSGKYNMVIDSEVAAKVVTPLLRALGGHKIQQENSFLLGSLGRRVLPEGLTILDSPHIKGQTGSRLFDSEGVATVSGPVIENGVVRKYFINTHMSGKLGMAPTVEDCIRAQLLPWPRKGLDAAAIMGLCGDGIYVTGFNGGNANLTTGDFSYGIEGFLFKDGKPVKPLSEMLVTGNFLTLWQGFTAAGEDSRSCKSKLIPTLAFANVDFSG